MTASDWPLFGMPLLVLVLSGLTILVVPLRTRLAALSTSVMQGDMVKVLSWYDNEWGFSNRVVDALLKVAAVPATR